MRHDPERDASAYLGGQMSPARRVRFSEHLLSCDACWSEVGHGQQGRRLLESTRSVAPAHLRERVRVIAEATELPSLPPRRWPSVVVGRRAALALTASAVVAVGVAWTGTAVLDEPPVDPPAVQAAVADFLARELPGRELPANGAPDLSALQLRAVGAGGGQYDGLEVDGYAYRDDAGRRVALYLSAKPFPTAAGAQALAGPDGPWTVRRGDVVVLCARAPHALLIVGEDDELVRSTAVALGVA